SSLIPLSSQNNDLSFSELSSFRYVLYRQGCLFRNFVSSPYKTRGSVKPGIGVRLAPESGFGFRRNGGSVCSGIRNNRNCLRILYFPDLECYSARCHCLCSVFFRKEP